VHAQDPGAGDQRAAGDLVDHAVAVGSRRVGEGDGTGVLVDPARHILAQGREP